PFTAEDQAGDRVVLVRFEPDGNAAPTRDVVLDIIVWHPAIVIRPLRVVSDERYFESTLDSRYGVVDSVTRRIVGPPEVSVFEPISVQRVGEWVVVVAGLLQLSAADSLTVLKPVFVRKLVPFTSRLGNFSGRAGHPIDGPQAAWVGCAHYEKSVT